MKEIKPIGAFEGEFELPGDKSITHRAVMLNAGAEGEAVVTHALMGGDCLSTCQCMRALGARIDIDGTTLCVHGTPRFRTGVRLNCGNSGTTMRLLTGFAAGKNIEAVLFGDESLSGRPMARVASPLSLLGADVRTTEGHAPVCVFPAPLRGAEIEMSIASAQVKSALLLAGLSAEGVTAVVEPQKTRDHTECLLAAMGADIRCKDGRIELKRSLLKAVDVCVPSDISSAAYFMALGALKGRTLCKNVGINPTRTGILTAFDRLGVRYSILNRRVSGGEETADILVEKSPMRGISLTKEDIPSMIDELPLVALLCAFADGESRISGASRQGERPHPHHLGNDRGAGRDLHRNGGRIRHPRQRQARGRKRGQLPRSPHRHDGGGGASRVRKGRRHRPPRMLRHFFPRLLSASRRRFRMTEKIANAKPREIEKRAIRNRKGRAAGGTSA